jgi:hypothetical protein
MKTIYYKHFLFVASIFATGMTLAQSANNSTIPFKEIHRKQFTDNFTTREIKKKQLEITPSQINLLSTVANRQTKEEKIRKKFRR